MDDTFDITTLLFLVVAVIIFLRLRSVLGRRTGNERPRYDPYQSTNGNGPMANENVVTLPRPNQRRGKDDGEFAASFEKRLTNFVAKGSPLAAKLSAIAKLDRDFDPGHFLDGAKAAYEMIVTGFAAGNRKILKPLLSRDVYESFSAAIAERERNGETVDFSFVGINKAEIADAELVGNTAHITVKFVSELISATLNQAGEVVDGDPKKVREVTDRWTFARDVNSRDPNWKLIATETEN